MALKQRPDHGARPKGRPTVAPYVVPYSGELPGPESDLTVKTTADGPRLAYWNERPRDRDRRGVLWARVDYAPRSGDPDFGAMHSVRQRECMQDLLCQVCRQPVGRNNQGYLFLDWPRPDASPTWPEGALTEQPPVCERHARTARELCPHAPHFVMLRVRLPRLWGVVGTAYCLTAEGWQTDSDIPALKYGDAQTTAVLATHLVRQLKGVTVIPHPT